MLQKLDLLNFAGRCSRVVVDDNNISRHFEVRQLSFAEIFHVAVFEGFWIVLEPDESADFLAHSLIGNADLKGKFIDLN